MKKFIILLLFSFFIFGCAEKQPTKILIKNNYIYSKAPILKIYENNNSLKLTAYNKNDKICIEEWKTCIPKNQMIILIKYTNSLKNTIKLYKNEVNIYNKWAIENNKKSK